MEKLNVKIENGFGIEKLDFKFDFSDKNNVYSIYARNGIMKTSFAKVFKHIQEDQTENIKDALFDERGSVQIHVDGKSIESKQVFVIKSFENSYQSDISTLLVNDLIKKQLSEVLKLRKSFLKELKNLSGIKSTGELFEIQQIMKNDLGLCNNGILLNLKELKSCKSSIDLSEIKYESIFDSTILKTINSDNFQKGIKNYIVASQKIYDDFDYLEKGKMTLPKLKDLRKSIDKDKFFLKDNYIMLSGVSNKISNMQELDEQIQAIEDKISVMPEFQAIESSLENTKGIILKDIIEEHQEIIPYLLKSKHSELKKLMWSSYVCKQEEIVDELIKKYNDLSSSIDAIDIDNTKWKKALDIFKDRFSVPFDMKIVNLKESVIGESLPQIEFSFDKNGKTKTINRDTLDKLDTLSQGEKRALYLLNIIFDIEKIKESGEEKIFIIDDIADSFDYKNKYAIVEYLYELSKSDNYKIIILTHNFDFHRTISSRLGISRERRYIADITGNNISLKEEVYQKNPFEFWKEKPNKKYILALIPFVRNLVEYGCDCDISKSGSDYKYLTNLLHEKPDSHSITFANIEPLYQKYIGAKSFEINIMADRVLETLYSTCDTIKCTDAELENKIILAMGIRHKAEEFMIKRISGQNIQLKWVEKKNNMEGSVTAFLEYVYCSANQTRELLNGYEQFGDAETIKVLEEVCIMTPENIHINSFMYEPILDMDIVELIALYDRVKVLLINE